VARYADGVAELMSRLADLLVPDEREAYEQGVAALADVGVPIDLARRVESAKVLPSPLDVVELAVDTGDRIDVVGAAYFAVGERLQLGWLRDQINALPSDNQWEMLAQLALQEDLYGAYRAATRSLLATPSHSGLPDRLKAWVSANRAATDRCDLVMNDIRAGEAPDAGTLGVALREIQGLIKAATLG